jgi:hypothetical protein
MSIPVTTWLNRISADSGLLACGVRLPQGSCVNQSFTPSFPSEKLDDVWGQLSEAVNAFRLRRIALNRLCWKYDRVHVWFVVRPDGLGLGLVFKPAVAGNRAQVEVILQDFPHQDWRLAA